MRSRADVPACFDAITLTMRYTLGDGFLSTRAPLHETRLVGCLRGTYCRYRVNA